MYIKHFWNPHGRDVTSCIKETPSNYHFNVSLVQSWDHHIIKRIKSMVMKLRPPKRTPWTIKNNFVRDHTICTWYWMREVSRRRSISPIGRKASGNFWHSISSVLNFDHLSLKTELANWVSQFYDEEACTASPDKLFNDKHCMREKFASTIGL